MLRESVAPRSFCWLCLFLLVATFKISIAAEVDISEVKRLIKRPVEAILQGAPIVQINDTNYWKCIQQSSKPVVVIFYINQEKSSRNLASLIRYLAIDFHEKIAFCAFEVSERGPVHKEVAKRLENAYSLDKTPGTFFYDNDKGEMELERENYEVPIIKEYRTPSMLFWKTYYQAIVKYIEKNILD